MATLLLTGATGFVGGMVLTMALASPAIGRVVSIQRAPLPAGSAALKSAKFEQHVLASEAEWTAYPAALAGRLAAIDLVVWALGRPRFDNPATAKRVSIDYTQYGLDRLLEARAGAGAGAGATAAPLRFTYVSGALTVRDQSASETEKHARHGIEFLKMRGRVENLLIEAATEHAGKLETVISRPAYIIDWTRPGEKDRDLSKLPEWGMIGIDELSAALLDVTIKGRGGPNPAERVLMENDESEKIGRIALALEKTYRVRG